ncbi:ABC transporter ATP-binding protein [Streptomyces sp. GKU 895]|nr:ABC transporter ATP-binding protein [Streptomyces sp. GKU 895]
MVSRSFVFTAAGALIGLFSLAPPLLLVVGLPLLAGLALFLATLRPLARRQEAFLVADETLAERYGALCPGLRDITAAGAEERVAADTGRHIDTERRAAASLARWGVLRVAALTIGGELPIVLLLVAAPWLLGQGVTPGALVGALSYVTQSLLPALRSLVHGLGTSGSRLVVVLRRLLREDGPASATPTGRPRHPADGPTDVPALTLKSVTFAYGPAAAPVVDGLDLELAPGTHLAVVGPSGIGKSTLTALVAGVLEPGHGVIRICGYPVPGAEAAAAGYWSRRRRTSTPAPWPRTWDCCGPDPVPEAELLAAAEAVGLLPLLRRRSADPPPRRPGGALRGERQLIALTRAWLSYAPLVLLDEATCHLDPSAEERAERAFAARPGGTLVVVAHRISSARRADRVLVMDGRTTAYGTHRDLLERSALYRDLVGGWSPVPSQPALALGDPDRVDAVAGPGLAVDGRHVVAHGPVGQVQAPGDLRDGGPLGGQG